ncbi:MAG: hypothetical protein Q4G24_12615 [Paracoccus sp. (in: a-proteobacteria)]|uniref:hypothetical protein n=1 Tax=Paracoccus sp. TaxID=267 RepID=UPI0026DFFDE9|nr:hypothetical protein [Paracoccus sp. (in: a-proteobacteria)]MDO5622301.1 hypothetical protein [Paracoccus sp. (in: a-proteobacteria)]
MATAKTWRVIVASFGSGQGLFSFCGGAVNGAGQGVMLLNVAVASLDGPCDGMGTETLTAPAGAKPWTIRRGWGTKCGPRRVAFIES